MARHFMLACRSPLRIVRSPATPRCFNFAGYRAASALTNQDCHQPAVVDGAEIATRGALDELEADNSIEAILARSRRKELVARAGPGAVRYLPSEDPNAFLLPDNRLEPAERKWQKLFVALPWLTFAAMLALPTLLVHGNLPYLLQRAEHEKQAVGRRVALADRVADFQVVNFGQMPDVLERPFPTMLILFHPATFASKVFVPALRDLEGLLRKAEIPVSIAALDLTASPAPPDAFLWEYPAAVAPHIQLILPRSMDGEAGVVDYDGVWDARSLAMAACRLRHKVSHRLRFLTMELQNTFLGCKKEELPTHKRSLSLPPRPSKVCIEGDAELSEIQMYVRNLGHRALQLQPLVVRQGGRHP